MAKLKVFMSWSGSRSHELAEIINEWLPNVIQNVEPWLSSEDIEKGSQWLVELNKGLKTAKLGLLVLTAENLSAPWLLFEAGAIAKQLPKNRCCPLLCGIKPSALFGPLAQFQMTTATDRKDMYKLLKTVNEASGDDKLEEPRLKNAFERDWGELSKRIAAVLAVKTKSETSERDEGKILEEILSTVRRIESERDWEETSGGAISIGDHSRKRSPAELFRLGGRSTVDTNRRFF